MKTLATKAMKNPIEAGLEAKVSSGSSRPAKPRRTNKPFTSQLVRRSWSEPLAQHDLDLIEKLVSLPDSEINLRATPETKANTFANRSRIMSSSLFKPYKQQITLRIDGDVLAWARRDGAGYQSRINAALRAAMMQELTAEQKQT